MQLERLKNLFDSHRKDVETSIQQQRMMFFISLPLVAIFLALEIITDHYGSPTSKGLSMWLVDLIDSVLVLSWWAWTMVLLRKIAHFQREAAIMLFDTLDEMSEK
jgi:hypothetical protein